MPDDGGGLEEHLLLDDGGRRGRGQLQRLRLQDRHRDAEHRALLHARHVVRVYTAGGSSLTTVVGTELNDTLLAIAVR